MKRQFMLGTVFSAALAVGAYAQAPAGQSPTGQQDASKSSSDRADGYSHWMSESG